MGQYMCVDSEQLLLDKDKCWQYVRALCLVYEACLPVAKECMYVQVSNQEKGATCFQRIGKMVGIESFIPAARYGIN